MFFYEYTHLVMSIFHTSNYQCYQEKKNFNVLQIAGVNERKPHQIKIWKKGYQLSQILTNYEQSGTL